MYLDLRALQRVVESPAEPMHLPAAELLLKQFLRASDDVVFRIPPQVGYFGYLIS